MVITPIWIIELAVGFKNIQITLIEEDRGVVSAIQVLITLLILPKGTVKNEGIFFAMLTVLIGLIVFAVILRKRKGGSDE